MLSMVGGGDGSLDGAKEGDSDSGRAMHTDARTEATPHGDGDGDSRASANEFTSWCLKIVMTQQLEMTSIATGGSRAQCPSLDRCRKNGQPGLVQLSSEASSKLLWHRAAIKDKPPLGSRLSNHSWTSQPPLMETRLSQGIGLMSQ